MSDDTRERPENPARDASAPLNGSDRNKTMFQSDGHLDAEMVSAWLDAPEDFSEPDRLAIENHLASCAECRQIAAEITAIVRAFQTVPFIEPPRSFAPTAAQAGLAATSTLPVSRSREVESNSQTLTADRRSRQSTLAVDASPWYERQMSALRWATAVAAILFVFVFSADLLGNMDTTGDDDDSAGFSETSPLRSSDDATSLGASPAEATNTTSAAAAAPAEDDQDGEDSGDEGEAADSAAGTVEDATTASGGQSQANATEQADVTREGVPNAATEENAETIPTTATEAAALSQESQTPDSTLSSNDSVADDGESDVLHLIELALVTLIAWFIIALVALPRMRRPPTT